MFAPAICSPSSELSPRWSEAQASAPHASTSTAKELVSFMLSGATKNPDEIFEAWKLMHFNSSWSAAIFLAAGDEQYPEQFLAEVRTELREQMRILVEEGNSLSPEVRNYRLNHALAAYAYFRPELEESHLIALLKDGRWQLCPCSVKALGQHAAILGEPAYTYVFSERGDPSSKTVLFRGTPPSTSSGRYLARLDNFSPLCTGVGYFQWAYVRQSLRNELTDCRHVHIVGHSQGGALALRAAGGLRKDLGAEIVITVAADSPAGDRSFIDTGLEDSRMAIMVYAHPNDVVPTKSGPMPKAATVVMPTSAEALAFSPAKAHFHIGIGMTETQDFEIMTGEDFNKTKVKSPPAVLQAIGKVVLGTPYALVWVAHLLLGLVQNLFAKVCSTMRSSQSKWLKCALALAALILIVPSVAATSLKGLVVAALQGSLFAVQYAAMALKMPNKAKRMALVPLIVLLPLMPLWHLGQHLHLLGRGL